MKIGLSLLFALGGAVSMGLLSAGPLDEAGFADLHDRLKPPAEEAWRTLPWQESVTKARAIAAREKKPVYMLVRSGNPLGCV
jgi:hypothetical protein